jgi:hypothetical protein
VSSKRLIRLLRARLDVGRLADGLDDRVEVVERDLEALEDVRPVARLAEVELGPRRTTSRRQSMWCCRTA